MLHYKFPFAIFLYPIVFLTASLSWCQGIEIDSVKGVDENGLKVNYAQDNGLQIITAGGNGVSVSAAGEDGVSVFYAGEDGVSVGVVDGDGYSVYSAKGYSANIQGDKNETGNLTGHIAQIYNRNTGNGPDVLALRVGKTNPTSGSNFITFYGGTEAVGAIDGNGSGGVMYKTTGADFAEMLPVMHKATNYSAGDIVAIQDGHISHNTTGAPQLMVITDQPALLGNQQVDNENHEMVSFVGQVPVKIRGLVQAGDWIISAGHHDGTGIAKSSIDINMEDQIVGLALESSSDPELKRINTIVGLDHSQAIKDHLLRDMQATDQKHQRELMELRNQIAELKKLIQAKD